MNATKKLISLLSACALLAATAPAFADPGRGGERDYQRQHQYYAAQGRDDDRGYQRGWDRRRAVVVQRPVHYPQPVRVERPMYYPEPVRVERPRYYAQPARIDDIIIPVAILGAVIGGYLYSHR